MPGRLRTAAAIFARVASAFRPATGLIWIVISRPASALQSREASRTSIAEPPVRVARNVMIAMTVTRALPATESGDQHQPVPDGQETPQSPAGRFHGRRGSSHRCATVPRRARGVAPHRNWSMRPRSCVAMTMDVPDLFSSTNRRRRRLARLGSTLPVGSSASKSSGRTIRARAIAARCFFPAGQNGRVG